jgi:hypothetical protein
MPNLYLPLLYDTVNAPPGWLVKFLYIDYQYSSSDAEIINMSYTYISEYK